MNAVVELLRADSRLTYAQVAEKLGLSLESVRWTAVKLRKNGEIDKRSYLPRGNEWPEAHIETLKALWADERPASEIAEILSAKGFEVSRNAVLGKVHRLDLSSRKKLPARTRPPQAEINARARANYHKRNKSRPPAYQATPRVARIYREPPPAPEMLMVSIFDLAPSSCRFPVGDPRLPGFAYCGVKHTEMGSYCPYHHSLAYQPLESQGRRNRDTNYVVRRYA